MGWFKLLIDKLLGRKWRVCHVCLGKKRFAIGTGKHSTVHRMCKECGGSGKVIISAKGVTK